ncbi:50S ribosomal protein L9 [Novosphingobium sediminicola]|uniref:Large ribosomal subunit protein bL9 n=1 Tax=Novosphingobium sediminicola TaxID=563162 RepID=A0A7W6CKW5_9SPHN|nr:50S ribosomal protein L9 [Novosphingobium sediminicola]MBB3953317.1 large subunit ribosomal protein L9 [Novosphingobium sediminicola]
MQIILLERIEKLGHIGDVVTVKDGYARNFLLPNKKALRANEANRKVFEAQRADIEKRNAEAKATAEGQSGDVEGKSVVLIRAASNAGHLYGSVSVRDIADGLNAEGAKVNKAMIVLERPIKSIGIYDVRVALHPEVSVTVKVNVARSPDEAELQAQGVNISEALFDNAVGGFTEAYDPNAEPGEIPSDLLEGEAEAE